jgi:uncharacterized protein (TIGR03435 family)
MSVDWSRCWRVWAGCRRGRIATCVALAGLLAADSWIAEAQQLRWRPATELPAFDVVSIKPADAAARPRVRITPGRLSATARSLQGLVMQAYEIPTASQLVGLSNRLSTTAFDVEATFPPETTPQEMRSMLQRTLIERFRLSGHVERRALPVFILLASGPLARGVTVSAAHDCPKPVPSQPAVDACNHESTSVASRRAGASLHTERLEVTMT